MTPVPDQIRATVTFAGIRNPQVHEFDRATLAAVIEANPAESLRFLVTAPDELYTKIPTGEYEFSVVFSLKYGNQTLLRTVRGTTAFINRVDHNFGSAEFGQRWTLAELNRIYFTSGQAQVAGIAAGSGSTSGSGGAGGSGGVGGEGSQGGPGEPATPGGNGSPEPPPLVRQGAADHRGLSLIRGDNTSAFFDLQQMRIGYDALPVSSRYSNFPGAWRDGVTTNANFPTGTPDSSTTRREIVTYNNLDQGTAYAVILKWPADGSLSSRVPVKVTGAVPVGGNGVTHEYRIDQTTAHDDGFVLGWFVPTSAGQIKVEFSTEGTGNDRVHLFDVDLVRAIDLFDFGNEPRLGEGTFSTIERLEKEWDAQTVTELVLKSQQTGTWQYFDAMGLLRVSGDKHGNLTRFEYTDGDNDGIIDDLSAVVLPGNQRYDYNYSSNGYLSQVVDPTSLVTEFQNTAGKVSRVSLPGTGSSASANWFFSFSYGPGSALSGVGDGRSNQTTLTNPDGHGLKTSVITAGDITKIRSELAAGFEFATSGILDSGDPQRILGRNNGRILIDEVIAAVATELDQAFAEVTDPRLNTFRLQHDARGQVTAHVDQSSTAKWITQRNEHGQVIRQIEPARKVARFMGAMNPVDFTVAGITTEYIRDENHNLTTIRHAAGTDEELIESWTWKLVTREIDDEVLDIVWVQENYTALDSRITRNEYADGQASPERIIENWQDGPGSGDPSDTMSRTTHYEYTPHPAEGSLVPAGLVRNVTVDGRSTEMIYYGATSPSGISVAQNQRRAGLVYQEIVSGGGLSQTTRYLYDDYRFIDKEQSWYGANPNPNLITERDFDYDRMGQLIQVVGPSQGFVINPAAPVFDGNGIPVVDGTRTGQLLKYRYDAAGNLTHAIEQRDNGTGNLVDVETVTTFDAKNRPLMVTYPVSQGNQNVVEYQYDGIGNVTFVTERLGSNVRVTENVYDNRNLLVKTISPAPVIPFANPADVPAAAMVRPVVHYFYDTNGNLLRETDARFGDAVSGDVAWSVPGTSYHYDIHDRLVATRQDYDQPDIHAAPVTKFDYDQAGRKMEVTVSTGILAWNGSQNPGLARTNYDYDGLGRLIQVKEPANAEQFRRTTDLEYDLRDNLKVTTVDIGHTTKNVETRFYDGLDRPSAIDHPDPLPGKPGLYEVIGYDLYGYIAARLELPGNLNPNDPGTTGNPVSVDAMVAMAQVFTSIGIDVRLTRMANDQLGNVIAVVSPDMFGETPTNQNLSIDDGSTVTINRYDLSGNVVRTDILFREFGGLTGGGSNGFGISYPNPVTNLTGSTEYDVYNRPIVQFGLVSVESLAAGRPETRVNYNADGSVMQMQVRKSAAGNGTAWASTDYAYDNLGRPVQITLPADDNGVRMTTWSFADANGNPIRTIDARNWPTDMSYDLLNRETRQTSLSNGLSTVNTYSAEGLLVEQQAPSGDRTKWAYDPAGNLRSIQQLDSEGSQPASTEVNWSGYDGNGSARFLVNGNGITEFVFDNLGRLIGEKIPIEEQGRSYDYDHFGNLLQKTDRNSRVTNYDYLATGQVARELRDNGSYVANFQYTPLGELRSANNSGQNVMISDYTYGYDSLRNRESASRNYGELARTISETTSADAYGTNFVHSVSVDGNSVFSTSYDLDNLGRLTGVSQSGPAVQSVNIVDDYTGNRPASTTWFRNGIQENQLVRGWNDSGRISTESLHKLGQPNPVNRSEHFYDAFDREISVASTADSQLPLPNVFRSTDDFSRPEASGIAKFGRLRTVNGVKQVFDPEGNVLSALGFGLSSEVYRNNENALGIGLEKSFNVADAAKWPHGSASLGSGQYLLKFKLSGSVQIPEELPVRFAIYGVQVTSDEDGTVYNRAGTPGSTYEFGAFNDGELLVEIVGDPTRQVIAIQYQDAGTGNWVDIDVNHLYDYSFSLADKRQSFAWNSANQLVSVVESAIQYQNGNVSQVDSTSYSFGYDALGNLISAETRTDLATGVSNSRKVLYAVDDSGNRLLAFESVQNPMESHTNRLVGASLLGVNGQTLAVQSIAELPDGNTGVHLPPVADGAVFVVYDSNSVARYFLGKSESEVPVRVDYEVGGRVYGADLNNQLRVEELARLYPGFDYIGLAEIYIALDGRIFSPESGTFLSESASGLSSGALNLYQPTAIAPHGTISPDNLGFNYYAKTESFWGLAAQPVFAVAQGVGGVFEVAGGAVYTLGTGSIGGFLGGGLVMAHGIDDIRVGMTTLWTGRQANSLTYKAGYGTARLLGASESTAGWVGAGVDVGAGFVGPASAAAAFAKVGRVASAVARTNSAGRYALAAGSRFANQSLSVVTDFGTGFHRGFSASARTTVSMSGLGPIVDGIRSGLNNLGNAPGSVAGLADDAVELAAQRCLVEMTGNTRYAHYLGKHSPLVSDQALIARATTGLDPWEGVVKTYQKGKKAGQPILYDSTRFNSYQDMLESIEKAQRALGARFPNGGIPANGATVTMDMLRDVGLGYGKDTGTLKTGLTRVRVHFDQYGQVISAFPLYK